MTDKKEVPRIEKSEILLGQIIYLFRYTEEQPDYRSSESFSIDQGGMCPLLLVIMVQGNLHLPNYMNGLTLPNKGKIIFGMIRMIL